MLTWKGEFKAYMTSIKHTHKKKKKKREKRSLYDNIVNQWYIRNKCWKITLSFYYSAKNFNISKYDKIHIYLIHDNNNWRKKI